MDNSPNFLLLFCSPDRVLGLRTTIRQKREALSTIATGGPAGLVDLVVIQ